MKPFLLGTNWKMNKTFKESKEYLKSLTLLVKQHPQYQYFVIPPYTHLQEAKKDLDGSGILLGAQNMHWEEYGAYTGEISPRWLADIGIDIAELGHSERRQYYQENDYDLNLKVKSALSHNFIALLCVGEYRQDKEYGVTREVIKRQVKIGLFKVSPAQMEHIWIAYEPVWAIGENGIPAEPAYVEQIHGYIREQVVEMFGQRAGDAVGILYGGSVNVENCVSISCKKNVDGLFIGRSAWDLTIFEKIITCLENNQSIRFTQSK